MKLLGATPYLRVSDVETSIAFYRDALGFEVVASMQNSGRTYWARLHSGPASLMLSDGPARWLPHDDSVEHDHSAPWPGPGREQGLAISEATWLYVDDADAAHARLRSMGFDPVDDPVDHSYGVRDFAVRDPDGYYYVIGHRLERPQT